MTASAGAARGTAAARGRRDRSGVLRWRVGLAVEVVAILAVWELVVGVLELVNPAFLPPPSHIGASLAELAVSSHTLDALLFSMGNVVVGLALAIVVGITVGLAVGWFRSLQYTVAPFLWMLYSTPKVALAPIIILGLGLGSASKVALVFLLAVFPIMLNTLEGVETVSTSLIRAGRVFGANGIALGRRVIFPGTFPFIIVGLQRGIALAFIGEVLGEFLGGSGGLGHDLERATFNFEMADALAIVVIIVVLANLAFLLLELARRKFAPWHESGSAKL